MTTVEAFGTEQPAPSQALATHDLIAPGPGPPGRTRRQQLRAHLQVPLFRNAYALMASTVITAVLGVVYWALAARYYPPAEVGRASAAISMMLLLSGIAQVNQHNILPRLIPLAGARVGRLVGRSYLTCAAIAGVASTIFVVFFGSSTFLGSYHSGWVDAWFVGAVVTWCIFTLQDAVLTGLRAAIWVPIENTAFSVAKIILLIGLAGTMPSLGLFTAWSLPVAVSIVPVTLLVYRRLVPNHRSVQVSSKYLTSKRSTSRYVMADAVGGLLQLTATMLLPVLVAAELGYADAGWFYAAWVVGSAFDTLMLNISASLTVEGAHDEDRLRELTRSLARGVVPLLALCSAIVVLSHPLLSLMGTSYADHAGHLLQLIGAGMVLRAVVAVSIALARVRRQVPHLLIVQSALCVLLLSGSITLSGYGLTGIGLAYAGTQTVVGLAVLPGLVGFIAGPTSQTARRLAALADWSHAVRGLAWRAATVTTGVTLLGGAGITAITVGLASTDATAAGGFGLANAFPVTYWVGLAALSCAAVIAALHAPKTWLLLPLCLALVVACQGAAGIVEAEPRFYTAWLHVGFINYLTAHHTTAPHLDARFSWPGMFAGAATVLGAAGGPDALTLLRWAPVVMTVACLPAVWSIAAWTTRSMRARWLTVVLFVLGDWVGQDYLSPQALVFVLALGVIAVAVRVLPAAPAGTKVRDWLRRPTRHATASRRSQRFGVLAAIVMLAATVAAHQLTPVFLVLDGIVLVAVRRTSFAALPALALAMFLGWLSLAAEPFWSGHLSLLFGGTGHLGSNVNSNVGGRVSGGSDHQLVVHLRMILTVLSLGLALLGAARWKHPLRYAVLALALAPFGVVLVQAYGGEAILRSYLFALPFVAALGARALTTRSTSPALARRLGTAVACVLALVMAAGFVVIRWGNERFEAVSSGEATALQWLYATAPHGSLIIDADQALPWRYTGLTDYAYTPVDNSNIDNAGDVYAAMRASSSPHSYFVASTEQEWYGEEVSGLRAGWLTTIVSHVATRRHVHLAYSSPDTRIYAYDAPRRHP